MCTLGHSVEWMAGQVHGRDGASSGVKMISNPAKVGFMAKIVNYLKKKKSHLLKCKRLHRIPTLSPFKKMLVLVITAGQSSWPLWLFICCSGTPYVAVVTRGHLHFQCSSDTICFLYFLAQRKRLRKQFNREREHTRTSTLQIEVPGCLLFRKHRLG